MVAEQKHFGFGIETEHLLVDEKSFNPLFHEDLPFDRVLDLIDGIPVADFTSDGFNIKPLHRKAIPYLVEGYYLTDAEMKPLKMLTKGIEVRTPISKTIGGTIDNLNELTERLRVAVSKHGWSMCSISHHPTKSNFQALRNYRRDDYWQWALTAMTTFGPDINISLPSHLLKEVDQASLGERINYYLPYAVALSFASPLLDGKLWERNGTVGKSVRTWKRSLWAPLYYVHTEPTTRFEFKAFEMSTNLEDYKAFFFIGLSLLVDNSLNKRASNDEAINALRRLAISGLSSADDKERAATILTSAENIASMFGFDQSSLKTMWQRLISNSCPADDIIGTYEKCGTVEDTMRHLAVAPMPRYAGPIQPGMPVIV